MCAIYDPINCYHWRPRCWECKQWVIAERYEDKYLLVLCWKCDADRQAMGWAVRLTQPHGH